MKKHLKMHDKNRETDTVTAMDLLIPELPEQAHLKLNTQIQVKENKNLYQ